MKTEKMKTLYLPLKAEYFDEIKSGEKKYEYRRVNKFWRKRLSGRNFAKIVLMKGYPKKDDKSRRIERPWRGHHLEIITHKHFGDKPVEVFAIRVN